VTLLVEAPARYEPERRYVLDVVLRDWLGLEWELRAADRDDVRITLAGEPGDQGVLVPDVLFATAPEDWLTEASLPTVCTLDRLPIIYGAPAPDPDRLAVDVFGAAFFMLTRYEELAVAERDEHDRFPTRASVAAHAGYLGTPVVDAYVELLWEAMQRTWPRLSHRPRAYSVALTHDVDDPLATLEHGPPDVVRQLGGDLVRRRDPRLAARRVRALLGDRDRDPNNTFDFLMDVSERHGVRSAFYFLAYRDECPRDGAFLFEHPWVRALISRVALRGHEVGLHPSFSSYRDGARIRHELERLLRVAEAEGVRQDDWGGRQHFLRWANPDTWRHWDAAGLTYDSTLGLSDAIGFRAGTCHPYRVFDLTARRPLRLVERPFQVMDVALLGPPAPALEAAHAAVMDVAAQCRRYGGELGILWHNNTLLRSGREQRWYSALVEAACALPAAAP
jgi:Family of unknown function (DUF7033)